MSNTLTRTDEMIAEMRERQRLERAVIEAAKGLCSFEASATTPVHIEKEMSLSKAVAALIEFESQQEK